MNKPKLQLALDDRSLDEALYTMRNDLIDHIDILEVGTWLILSEGIKAIRKFRELHPDKEMVADGNCTDANFLTYIMKEGADLNTVIGAMSDDLMKEAIEAAKKMDNKMQIALYGDLWTLEDCRKFRKMGAEYIVVTNYHDEWTETDIENVKKICDMGYKVSVADGITYETLDMFKGIPLYAIVMGGAIRKAADPVAAADRIQDKLREIWR